jgi:hypothetical protein
MREGHGPRAWLRGVAAAARRQTTAAACRTIPDEHDQNESIQVPFAYIQNDSV